MVHKVIMIFWFNYTFNIFIFMREIRVSPHNIQWEGQGTWNLTYDKNGHYCSTTFLP